MAPAGRPELRPLAHLAHRPRHGHGARTTSTTHLGRHHQIVIHLDGDLLRPAEAIPAVAASLDDGTPVSAEALRRIACDAGLVPALVSDQGSPSAAVDALLT